MKALHDLLLPASLCEAIQAARNRLTAECSVERLMLFGSVVRGEADAESDADLLIVLTEPPTAQVRDRITSLILDINLAYDFMPRLKKKGFRCDQ
jgi:predicted nucleotidyltransferase